MRKQVFVVGTAVVAVTSALLLLTPPLRAQGRQGRAGAPNTQPATVEAPLAKEEPVYQVFLPPLIYDANAKVQPEIDPKMIVLVRRVRVRPTLIFQGRVEGVVVAAATPPPSSTPPAAANAPKPAAPASDSLVDRVRNFVRKLWPSS